MNRKNINKSNNRKCILNLKNLFENAYFKTNINISQKNILK